MTAETQPRSAEDLLSEARHLEKSGRKFDARQLLQQVLAREPGNAQALNQLGLMEIEAGELYEGERHFEMAVEREPDSAEFRNNLAATYLKLGRPDKAQHQARTSDKLRPHSAETIKILSQIAERLGRPQEFMALTQRGLTIKNSELLHDMAEALDSLGRTAEAVQLFRSLIAAGHRSTQAYNGIARSQTFSVEPPEYAQMDAWLATGKASADGKRWLHSALGKIDEDLGRYDRAFANFQAARSPGRAAPQVIQLERELGVARQIFTRQFFEERRNFGSDSVRPIFIVGMPRSGTTLTEQILASHPEIHGAGELVFFLAERDRQFPHDRTNARYARAVRDWPVASARAVAGDYLTVLKTHDDSAKRVVDKMPHNFQLLGLIALLFPRATIIHCRRSPISNCVSCFTRMFDPDHAYAEDLAALGRYYRLYYAFMEHWHRELPITVHDVQYEELVAEPEAQSRRLVAATGLEWNDACLDFHKTKRSVRTRSRRQVEQPIYTQAVEAWRHYSKYLNPLIEALGDLGPPKI